MFQDSRKPVIKTPEQIEGIKLSGDLLGRAHAEVARSIRPGIRTIELDKIAHDFIRDHGGRPAFLGFGGFPNSLCISVNDMVVHGIPNNYVVKEGDTVNIDCGVNLRGFFSDSAYTYPVGEITAAEMALLRETRAALFKGIEQCKTGNRVGDISFAIESHARLHGLSVVRELTGHGVGLDVHEAPEVPNYGKKGTGVLLRDGMVLAIEPMFNLGNRQVYQANDGWTIRTKDGKPSCQYEHTVGIVNGQPELLTTWKYLEEFVNF